MRDAPARGRLRARRSARSSERIAAGKPIGRPHLAEAVLGAPGQRRSGCSDEEIDDVGSLIRGYLIEGKPGLPPARDADRRRGDRGDPRRRRRGDLGAPVLGHLGRRRSARRASTASARSASTASRPSTSPTTSEQTRAARRALRRARPAEHRLGRLPRAREPPVLPLPRVRDLRPRAEPRADRATVALEAARVALSRPSSALQAVGERLERQLLGDVQPRGSAASSADQLDRPRAARAPSRPLRVLLELARGGRPRSTSSGAPRTRTARRAATARPGAAPRSSVSRARAPLAAPPRLERLRARGVCAPWPGSSSSSSRRAARCGLARRRAPAGLRARSSSAIHGRSPVVPGERRAHEALGAARAAAAPSSLASRAASARVAERQRARTPARARARRRSSARAIALGGERIEAHVLAARGDRRQHVLAAVGQQQQVHERGRLLERLQHAGWPPGRSSSRRASITNTRRADSNGVRVAAATTGSSMSADQHLRGARGRAPRSGPGARRARTRSATALRICARRRPAAPRRRRARSRACRCPAGPWNRYACEAARPAAQRRREHRARVRVRVDARQRAARPVRMAPHARRGRSRRGTSASTVPRVARGRLITIEGLDGAGKSTLASALARGAARRAGIAAQLLREPGGVRVSERIRALRQGPGARASRRAPRRCSTPPRAPSSSQELLVPLLGEGAVRAARPLRRLLARLPGRRRAASGSSRCARSTSSRPAGLVARPHAAAAHLPRRSARERQTAERDGSPTGSSARTRSSSRAIAAAYEQLARAEPERIRVLDATASPAARCCGRARRVAADARRPRRRLGSTGREPAAFLLVAQPARSADRLHGARAGAGAGRRGADDRDRARPRAPPAAAAAPAAATPTVTTTPGRHDHRAATTPARNAPRAAPAAACPGATHHADRASAARHAGRPAADLDGARRRQGQAHVREGRRRGLRLGDPGRRDRRAARCSPALVWAVFALRRLRTALAASARHSVAEAGFRASATWAEFSDWARLGH